VARGGEAQLPHGHTLRGNAACVAHQARRCREGSVPQLATDGAERGRAEDDASGTDALHTSCRRLRGLPACLRACGRPHTLWRSVVTPNSRVGHQPPTDCSLTANRTGGGYQEAVYAAAMATLAAALRGEPSGDACLEQVGSEALEKMQEVVEKQSPV
jgi:hypothetical protein